MMSVCDCRHEGCLDMPSWVSLAVEGCKAGESTHKTLLGRVRRLAIA
jgi:hypothetical protein